MAVNAVDIETYLKIAALVSGGLFFGWKVWTGWLVINLSVGIETQRVHLANGQDAVSIKVNLDKGPTDTLYIQDLSVRVTETLGNGQNKVQILDFPELKRLNKNNDKLVWKTNSSNKQITLSPSEKAHFSNVVEVGYNNYCLIEVAVLGIREARGDFQWRTSAVSLPLSIEHVTIPQNFSQQSEK